MRLLQEHKLGTRFSYWSILPLLWCAHKDRKLDEK